MVTIALSETLHISESAHTSLRYASVGLGGFLKIMFPSASTLHMVLETAILQNIEEVVYGKLYIK